MKKLLACLALAFVVLAAPAQAGPLPNDIARRVLEDATAAYHGGDYAIAVRLFRSLAKLGNAPAQFNLGIMYRNGLGVPQDYAEAVKWWRKAAEQGDASAQYNLGLTYDKGLGVPQDYAEAIKWYRKGAEQGQVDALANLGYMYDKAMGVPQDYVTAHMWYNLAAALGHAKVSRNRDWVAAKMTPADISKAQKQAREWLAKHRKK